MTPTPTQAPITRFAFEYRFLSNFYPSPIFHPNTNRLWPTVEHAYQAAKTYDVAWQSAILNSGTPQQAKSLGHAINKRPDLLRPDWRQVNLDIMAELLMLKFQDPQLRAQLIDTGARELVEGNTWGDTFFGVCKGEGENWLGRLLMVVRELVAWE